MCLEDINIIIIFIYIYNFYFIRFPYESVLDAIGCVKIKTSCVAVRCICLHSPVVAPRPLALVSSKKTTVN